MSESRTPSLKIRVLGYGLFVLFFVGCVVVLELAGYGYLRYRGEATHRLFVKRGAIQEAAGLLDTRDSFSYLDPLLSHSHNPAKLAAAGFETIPGFAVFGAVDDPEALTIVALGGSTTDPLLAPSWPALLADRLAEAGVSARVLNGGVAGYSSNQELLKLIRDVLPLAPDLVLSLNGVNDLGFMHATKGHPMVHPYQKRVVASVAGGGARVLPVLPNAGAALGLLVRRPSAVGLSLGTPVRASDYEHWYHNVRTMHAVASEYGIPYRCFLQPILGAGAYAPTSWEQRMFEQTAAEHAHYRDYPGEVGAFYDGARARAAERDYIVDFTNVFVGRSGMYSDARHQNEDGRGVLADAIFVYCREAGLLGGG